MLVYQRVPLGQITSLAFSVVSFEGHPVTCGQLRRKLAPLAKHLRTMNCRDFQTADGKENL